MADQDRATGTKRVQRGKGLTLALLTSVYFFYLLDRNAVLVTQELFKAEFGLSDGQVGLVTGLIYGVAYAMVGLPLGRVIERVDRHRLLALLVAIWSSVTMLCGLSTHFWHLAAARFVVGAAESGGAPAALMIIRESWPEHRRATASSIFFAGAGVGGIASFLLGGYIAQHWGWRAVFFLYGAPGLALAALIWLTARDRGSAVVSEVVQPPPLWASIRLLLSDRALRPIYLGSIAYTFSMSGVGSWLVPYLMRVHGVQVGQAGLIVALAFGLLSTVGSIGFGFLADACERRGRGAMLRLLALAAAINGMVGIAAAFAPGLTTAILAIGLWGLGAIVYSGTANAAIGRLAPSGAQGMAFALFAVLSNLVGAGLGPFCAGLLSELFQPDWGSASVRPALAILAGCQIVTAAAFLHAARRYRQRLAGEVAA